MCSPDFTRAAVQDRLHVRRSHQRTDEEHHRIGGANGRRIKQERPDPDLEPSSRSKRRRSFVRKGAVDAEAPRRYAVATDDIANIAQGRRAASGSGDHVSWILDLLAAALVLIRTKGAAVLRLPWLGEPADTHPAAGTYLSSL